MLLRLEQARVVSPLLAALSAKHLTTKAAESEAASHPGIQDPSYPQLHLRYRGPRPGARYTHAGTHQVPPAARRREPALREAPARMRAPSGRWWREACWEPRLPVTRQPGVSPTLIIPAPSLQTTTEKKNLWFSLSQDKGAPV